jgi:hypothetical protein
MATAAQPTSFTCPHCGKAHPGWPTDYGYTLPDDVWAIPEAARASRAKWTSDLCQLDDRHFIRGLLKVRFVDQPGYFGWGLWVEVDAPTFYRYLALYDKDGSGAPTEKGSIANQPPGYEAVLGEPVTMQFGESTQRPEITFAADASCSLASEQMCGIDSSRYHQILVAVGAIEP